MREPETELIAAAKAGDQDAFAELYKLCISQVEAACRAILHTEDVEDLVQEVFLAVSQDLTTFRGKSSFRTWVVAIARKKCFTELRGRTQLKNGSDHLVPLEKLDGNAEWVFTYEPPAEKDWGARRAEASTELDPMLCRLFPAEQEIIAAKYLDELTESEIAARSALPVGTIRSRLYRAMEALGKLSGRIDG